MTRRSLTLKEEQVLAFRARRGHLLGPGATDPVAAARVILGAQSQQLGTSLFALSQRTKSRPTHAQLEELLFGTGAPLVRTWGQRDTIHVYDAVTHWRSLIAARQQWSQSGRRGAFPPEALVRKTLTFLREEFRAPATRKDIQHLVSKAYLQDCIDKMGTEKGALPFAAGRILWTLAHRGATRLGPKIGAEQQSVVRELWHEGLPWPGQVEAQSANVGLVRQTLALHGAMTVQDIAHFWGAKVRQAKAWVDELEEESPLLDVTCGDRVGLLALAEDHRALARKVPDSKAEAWPVRLLPQWDTLLMGHADKSWTVPVAEERKQVWKIAAVVAPAVLARGRIVATWSHRRRAKAVDVLVQPLSGWRKTRHLSGVRKEAKALAAFYELADATVTVEV